MEYLDDPTVLEIFSFLDSVSLIKISGLSKHHYELSRENSLWINLLKREFGTDRYLEKYKTNVVQAFKVAKSYRKIATESLATTEIEDEKLASSNSLQEQWADVREFISIIELKRGGLVLCTDDDYRRLIVNSIVHMLFCYPGTSIYCSWEGTGVSLYDQTTKAIDANIRECDKRGVISPGDVNYNFYLMNEKPLENGSAFFYQHITELWRHHKITYHSYEIFINILCGDALYPLSQNGYDASHMLDENVWPQEHTIHVVTKPYCFGGELQRLWEYYHLKGTLDWRFSRGYFDCLIDTHWLDSAHDRLLIDTKLWCDGRVNFGEGNDREGLWKKFTGFHKDTIVHKDYCLICKELKKQK